jgi:DDE family transposase
MATLLAPTPLTDAERTQTLSEVEQTLKDAVLDLAAAPPAPGQRAPGRPPILSALGLWGGLLVCVLHGFSSYLDLWRLLTGLGLWQTPTVAVSDQALYARLARDGTGPLERLFAHLSTLLADRLAPWTTTALAPFAAGVYALDEMTLDQVARLLPARRGVPAGAAALLPGKLTGVFDLRRQQWARVEYQADAQQNEKLAARGMLAGLVAGSLILADLGYFGFQWFDELTTSGFWWVSRLRAKTSYTVVHPLYQRGDTLDAIIWLGAHRADRAQYAVRLVQFRHGGTLFRYVTNVLDPMVLAMAAIARLYARRWDIELAFNLIKTHLKLHLLWGAKPVVVLQQVWAVLIIAQVLQALRVEIAGRAGVDPYDVSLPLLVKYLPAFAYRGLDPVATLVERGEAMRIIRPSSRTVIVAPEVPHEAITPAPPDLVLERTPRYAERKCGPRARSAA